MQVFSQESIQIFFVKGLNLGAKLGYKVSRGASKSEGALQSNSREEVCISILVS